MLLLSLIWFGLRVHYLIWFGLRVQYLIWFGLRVHYLPPCLAHSFATVQYASLHLILRIESLPFLVIGIGFKSIILLAIKLAIWNLACRDSRWIHLFFDFRTHILNFKYRISLNKRTCLNKRAPYFWIWSSIFQPVINVSQWKFWGITFRHLWAHVMNFFKIGQGRGLITCLCARCVYLAKYGRWQMISVGSYLRWHTHTDRMHVAFL